MKSVFAMTHDECLSEIERLQAQHEARENSLGLKIVKAVRALAGDMAYAGIRSGLEVRLSATDFKSLQREVSVLFPESPRPGVTVFTVETACGPVSFVSS